MEAGGRIELKSGKDLAALRRAGRLAARALREVGAAVAPGITTRALDRIAESVIRRGGGIPTFLGYRGYPACICVSLNEEVVHGIPSGKRILREGDIVSVDVGATLDGFVGDTAETFPVGEVNEEKRALMAVTRDALARAVDQAWPGRRLGDIGHAVQSFAESRGYGVVRDFVGHGVGRKMHEEPAVPNYGEPGTGLRLEEGMVLALEPMVNAGTWRVRHREDGWTVVTDDGRPSAHFEHTVAVTVRGPRILTLADDEEGDRPA